MECEVMIIGSHPDDVEIGMGGTVAALRAAGKSVVIVDLTDGEPTPHGSVEIRKKESAAASKLLDVTERVTLDIPNRAIFDTVENRNKVAAVMRLYKPKVLFTHYWEDGHPDHIHASHLTLGSRFYSKLVKSELPHEPHFPGKIYYYFSMHMRLKIQPSFIFDITPHFERKMAAIKAYHSQFVVHEKNREVLLSIEHEAQYWGSQIGVRYGEPLLCKEYLRVGSVDTLLNG